MTAATRHIHGFRSYITSGALKFDFQSDTTLRFFGEGLNVRIRGMCHSVGAGPAPKQGSCTRAVRYAYCSSTCYGLGDCPGLGDCYGTVENTIKLRGRDVGRQLSFLIALLLCSLLCYCA